MPRTRRPVRALELLISCEHGGNHIPQRYRDAFAGADRALASHRGYDRGALLLAREFAAGLRAPLVYSTTSRLLIELNRSLHNHHTFSEYARRLPAEVRAELVKRYYLPYRDAIERRLRNAWRRGRQVLHLSCHSFTPRRAGIVRTADIGLLFDSQRAAEADFCRRWQAKLHVSMPACRVRRNYPYRGSADGLTTALRAKYGRRYLGIELEVNQKFPKTGGRRWQDLRTTLIETFSAALADFGYEHITG
jgi:predicted N-formylglutamate amidohydrolase